ncbi:hypothetical protein O4J56_22580 [Nocardiopsis sp. RSe5-2]|uniref:Scramblase n=1 Tax=Nocardiopsis endophytica TaxID=3018445 RepID=A0ABT4U924_9ACTN|nr:hypothetical protein [Nocardiopsis endophytica]MDA2813449.1 hypothetical protein [Nocardiopsis endophytica]
MNVNPLVIGSVDNSEELFGGLAYELRDTKGTVLARVHEDLGESAGKRLVRAFARSMMNTRTLVVDSPDGERLLVLEEERTRTKSRTSVSTPSGDLIGTVTRTDRSALQRRFTVHDASHRKLASLGINGFKTGWEGCTVQGPGKRSLARIAVTGRRNSALKYFADFTVRQKVRLADPLPLLLRVAPMPLDYAETVDR